MRKEGITSLSKCSLIIIKVWLAQMGIKKYNV